MKDDRQAQSGDRIQKIPDTATEFTRYVWTEDVFGKKQLAPGYKNFRTRVDEV